MTQFGSSWYKGDWYEDELNVLWVLIYKHWDARKGDSSMFSSSIYNGVIKLSLIIMYASASCVHMLCAKPKYKLLFLSDICKVSGNKSSEANASLLQNSFT